MPPTRNRLKNLLLKELSLVDHPANQHARIALFKRLWPFGKSAPTTAEGLLAASLESIRKDASLSDEEREELLAKSQAEYDAFIAKDDTDDDGDTAEDTDDDGDGADMNKFGPDAGDFTGDPTTPTREQSTMNTTAHKAALEAIQKSANEAVEKAQKAAEEAVAKANAVIAQHEDAERLSVAKSLVAGSGAATPDDVAAVLKQLDAKGQETVKAILAKAASFAKASNLFTELGKDGDDATVDATSALEKAAVEFRKADPKLSKEQALSKALIANPELYEQTLS